MAEIQRSCLTASERHDGRILQRISLLAEIKIINIFRQLFILSIDLMIEERIKTMDSCPICRSNKPSLSITCICGYDFEKEEIIDNEKIREYFFKIKSANNWEEEIKLTRRIHEVQQKKYGKTQRGMHGGWKESDTGTLLNIAKSTVNDNIRLAEVTDEYPEIMKNEKKTRAIKQLSNLNKGILSTILRKQFKTEKNLQSYLETNWKKIELFNEWNLKESQKNITGGVIDILAHHKSEPKWLIIELKKDMASDKAVGQIQRYMGWVKENLALKSDEVIGLIISGYPPGENIRLALLNNKNIDQQIYCLENDQIRFMDTETAFDFFNFEKYPIEKQIELLKKKT